MLDTSGDIEDDTFAIHEEDELNEKEFEELDLNKKDKKKKEKFDLRKASDTSKQLIRYGIRLWQILNILFYSRVKLV
jgi:uncharacterized protein with gpF-like domain